MLQISLGNETSFLSFMLTNCKFTVTSALSPATMKYKEQQVFRYWEAKLMIMALGGLSVYRLIEQIIDGPDGRAYQYLIILALLGLTYYIMTRLQMKVVIGKKGIRYEVPLLDIRRKIRWSDVEEVKVVRSTPGAEFSGWGQAYGPQYEVRSLVGSRGLLILLKDGQEILVGLSRPNEAYRFLQDKSPEIVNNEYSSQAQ